MIELRPTRAEDLPALSALFAERFGHPLEPDEHDWKYRLIPGEARSRVAVDAGEVVAHAGALKLPARWRGEDRGIWQLVDFAGTTRRRGLRPALVELGRELLHDLPRDADVPFLFGFPSERHFRLGERVFGYRPLAAIPVLGGELPSASAPPDIALGTSDRDEGRAEPVWARCGVDGVRRSKSFLDWRYWARPRRYYRFYRLLSGAEEGLVVFAFVGEEAWAAEVWLPASGEWYPSMLAVAADLRATGLRAWRFWEPPLAWLRPLYEALGLRPTGERRFAGCRGRIGDPRDPIAAAAGFTFSLGDYDLV
jgi:hypothetical protein